MFSESKWSDVVVLEDMLLQRFQELPLDEELCNLGFDSHCM